MTEKPHRAAVENCLKSLRIIHFALVGGLAMFAGITLWLNASGELVPQDGTPIVTWVALATTVMCVVMSFVIPKLVVANMPETTGTLDPGLRSFMSASIIGAALLEGPGFLCLVAWMLEGEMIAFVVGVLMMGGILLRMPNEERLEAHLAER